MAHYAPFGPAYAGAVQLNRLPLAAAVRSALMFAALAGPGSLAFTLFDAMLAYSGGPLRVALNVTNLTDKVQISTCLARGDCFYGQRRAVALTARYTF
jgi:outer membrane receptor protein involved in Fe transport